MVQAPVTVDHFETLRRHLHRGGQYAFWTFESEARKEESDQPAIRRSIWFEVDNPKPLPSQQGRFGPQHVWFGVHPCLAIPTTNRAGEARESQYVRSQVAYIAAVNCLYSEFDDKDFEGGQAACLAHVKTLAPAPSVVVRSGGGYQCYWLLIEPWQLATAEDREKATAVQHAWVALTGGDDGAKNLNRVLRVPGTINYKSKYGPDYPLVEIVSMNMARLYGLDELVGLIPPEMLERARRSPRPESIAHSLSEIVQAGMLLDMLAPWRCDEYDPWFETGAALAELGDAGLTLWETWSQQSAKFADGECERKWKTISDDGKRSLGSLYYWAKQDNPGEYARLFEYAREVSNGHSGHRNGVNGHHAPAAPVVEIRPDLSPDDEPEPEAGEAMPGLPGYAQAIYRHLRDGTGAWLDQYIAFATEAAPMTPRSFHEAAGLFAGSVAVARRLVLRVSTTAVYPNLYMLFVAPSTIYSKTTGVKIVMDLFYHSGMQHFLLPQRMTPEAMIQELSLGVPTNLNMADQDARASWMKERALAAQRGWTIDEASGLFDSLKRDFNSGLLPLLLNLYECPEKTTEQTVGRWRVTVHKAYLPFFGATNPAAMKEHLTNNALWTNGLWARFALIAPDEPPCFKFFPDHLDVPPSLVAGLQRLAGLFPMPEATLVEIEDTDGTRRKVVELSEEIEPSQAFLEPGVWQAWESYARGLHELLIQQGIEAELHSSYGRLHMQAIKVAMILAAMDSQALPVRVGLRHFASAQQIVEGWRASLHRLRKQGAVSQEESIADKIIALLLPAGAEGLKTRDIYRPLNKGMKEIRPLLDELAKQGRIECVKAVASNGRGVEMWRYTLAPGAQPEVS